MYQQPIRRGDIYYVEKGNSYATGSEIGAGRPCIIVSNDIGNDCSPVVEIVYLTTQQKKPMPTHAKIYSSLKPSTALCEQIMTVSKERIGEYLGYCTEDEMEEVDKAILVSLGLNQKQPTMHQMVASRQPDASATAEIEKLRATASELLKQNESLTAQNESLHKDAETARIERDAYKDMVMSLMQTMKG